MENEQEFRQCAESFEYFSNAYLKAYHPKQGVIPLFLYPFQNRLIETYEKERFVIGTKFRQGGFTTITVGYLLWLCMFRKDQTILCTCKTDAEAIHLGRLFPYFINFLPDWLKPKLRRNNDHSKEFEDTGSSIGFHIFEAACGRSLTHLFIDEAAFIPKMDRHWMALFPTIACGGKAYVLSTTNGVGNWFYDIYQKAKKGENDFEVFRADYWEHPSFNNPEWAKNMRSCLGEKGWLQEIMQEFVVESDDDPFDRPTLVAELSGLIRKKSLSKRQKNAVFEAVRLISNMKD